MSLEAFLSPILNSAMTTMLGVCPLFFVGSYILNSFAKLMVVVILLGTVHGVLVIPTLLSLLFMCRERPDNGEVVGVQYKKKRNSEDYDDLRAIENPAFQDVEEDLELTRL